MDTQELVTKSCVGVGVGFYKFHDLPVPQRRLQPTTQSAFGVLVLRGAWM
jgi:hypothetical protein